MPYPKNQASLDRWKAALDAAIQQNRAPWDTYDAQFMRVVQMYNSYLATTSGFFRLDWHIAKALSWVECGAANEQWTTKPMQIGVLGDPGLHQLLQTASGKLILPDSLRYTLTMSGAVSDGNRNIEAGVGYLLWVFARFGYREHPASPASSAILALSPPRVAASSPTHSGASTLSGHHHRLKHAPTHKEYAIVGWKPFSLVTIALHYNGGDGNYLDKLQYALTLVNNAAPSTERPSK